jgi:hypothetical protein
MFKGLTMERVKPRKGIEVHVNQAHPLTTSVSDLERYFGYNTARREGESPFDIPKVGLVCIVANVTSTNQAVLRQKTQFDCEIGDWLISSGGSGTQTTHGPFKTADKVFGFARSKLNAVRFIKQSGSEA